MRSRWSASAIVVVVAIVGAHPFCNWMFHCGCELVSLTAHCNIHQPSPPHCPWCHDPRWFAFSALLALAVALAAMALVRRRSTALLPSVAAGIAGLVAGGWLGALVTGASG